MLSSLGNVGDCHAFRPDFIGIQWLAMTIETRFFAYIQNHKQERLSYRVGIEVRRILLVSSLNRE
jgi:hypothetical protein